jgi:hypothetical protein
MLNDAVKNALGESYTAPFRLSTFLLYARSTHDKKSKFAPNGERYPLVGGTRERHLMESASSHTFLWLTC